jgi:predicted nucleic acid-binding protein
MTRFVLHLGAALELARQDVTVPADHELLAPTLLRSQALSAMHSAAHRGELVAEEARRRLMRLQRLPIRLLGDAVLRRVAWEVADRLGWEGTEDAEYVALTILQADALITLDSALARSVTDVVTTAPLEALRDPSFGGSPGGR